MPEFLAGKMRECIHLDLINSEIIQDLVLKLSHFRRCKSISFGNYWNDVDSALKMLKYLYVQWSHTVMDIKDG